MCALCFVLYLQNTIETQKKVAFCTPLHTIAGMDVRIGKSGNVRCPFEVRFYESGKLRRKRFKSKGDAALFAAELQKERFLPDDFKLSPEERIVFKNIKDVCAAVNLPLSEVCSILRQYAPARAVCGCEWTKAFAAYLDDLHKRGARQTSIDFYKGQIGLFYRRVQPIDIKDVDVEGAERYLAEIASPGHAKRALRAFYNFCVGQKWIADNPFVSAKIPKILKEIAQPAVLSVEDTARFMAALPSDWRVAAAIMAFAGVRPAEIVPLNAAAVLRFGDIDFDAKKITIRPEVSKVRRPRVLANLPRNLWAWLDAARGCDAAANVAPGNYDCWRRAKDTTGVKLPKDVLRHSFASYGYHYLGAERTVEILGHIGGFGVFAKHYKGLANAADAKKYFTILP